MQSLKILINQHNSIKGPAVNKKIMLDSLSEEFDVSIFPEMFFSGYLWRDYIRDYEIDLEFIDEVKGRIGNRMIIFGAPYYDGFLNNSAFVVTENHVEIYNKMHLPTFGPFEEDRYFKRGNKPFSTEFRGFKINVQICYDLFFHDTIVRGSDIIVNISASPFTSRNFFERVFPSVSINNQAYFVYVNTAGLQRNQVFWGGSRVLDPNGGETLKLDYFRNAKGSFVVSSDELDLSRIKRMVLKENTNGL